MPKIIFEKDGVETIVEAQIGESLLEAASRSGVKLFGGCGGAGVCGTCHVYIDESFLDKINEPENDELDLLDVLPNAKPNSRLGCQVIVSDSCDGMRVVIP